MHPDMQSEASSFHSKENQEKCESRKLSLRTSQNMQPHLRCVVFLHSLGNAGTNIMIVETLQRTQRWKRGMSPILCPCFFLPLRRDSSLPACWWVDILSLFKFCLEDVWRTPVIQWRRDKNFKLLVLAQYFASPVPWNRSLSNTYWTSLNMQHQKTILH